MKLNNKVYEVLKWVALIAFPAFAWFYGVIAEQWGLPYASQIVATLNAVGTLIGLLIGVSTYAYRKGLENNDNE